MFFIDISEECGYSIDTQCSLFESIKPLFANKPTVLVISKIDVMRLESLDEASKDRIMKLAKDSDVEIVAMSTQSEEGLMEARNFCCEKLLQFRLEHKVKGSHADFMLETLRVTAPQTRDDMIREPFVPVTALTTPKYDPNDPNRRILERDLEEQNGGAGIYSADLKKNYILNNDEWKYDVIPEIMEGRNISDFIDPDIQQKLDQLEEEEENRMGLEVDEPEPTEEDIELKRKADAIRDKRLLMVKNKNIMKKSAISRKLGIEKNGAENLGKRKSVSKILTKSDRSMDVDDAVDMSSSTGILRNRIQSSLPSIANKIMSRSKAHTRMAEAKDDMDRAGRRRNAKLCKRGEGDRDIAVKMPKHLFSSKMSNGSRSWR